MLIGFEIISMTTGAVTGIGETPGDHFTITGVTIDAVKVFPVVTGICTTMGIIGIIPVAGIVAVVTLQRGHYVVVIRSCRSITVMATSA